ncbi:MAG: hypothetical protein COY66_01360 [Candidatus Kerfeldbacteria bacterium CG_4_10_14_0_8_um_filter_42_10]|uniref:Uncharacterized protein n=1 Tax=Candidatus Kerfeldbacteria bacterium CG_4_10_14_0_8_um_filter_42_10 TaxID=2014248 RepID=A0A2M7RKI7_9BACT|nr:MAG: hypothetical protein COY66_01360 [Candidatus Kerfeldbacteria bacterium CG_4_10_14_0_8_um_filter_42_10]
MFTKKPKIKKSSWHYKVWAWTWNNKIWDKRVPTVRSICPYFWRTVLIGLLLLPVLHVFHYVFWPFKKTCRTNFRAAFAFWLVFTGLLLWLKVELIIITVICFFSLMIIGAFAIVGLGWCLKKLSELGTFKPVATVVSYDWQVYRRYYVPKYHLPVEEFDYSHWRYPMWLHLLFWLQPLILMAIVYFGGRAVLPPEMIDSGAVLLKWALIILGVFYFVVTPLVMWRMAVLARRELYRKRPELRPEKKRSKLAIQIEDTWELFCTWLKATKEGVCPLVEFVD